MAKKNPGKPVLRIMFQVTGAHAEDWVERLDRIAAALGLGRSAYIRLAVNERMQRDDPTESSPADEV